MVRPSDFWLMLRRRKRCRAKVLWEAAALPVAFRGGNSFRVGKICGGDDGFDCVGGGVTGVTGHVGGGGGVTGSTRNGTHRTFIRRAGSGVGGNGGGARLAASDLTPRPGTRGGNGFTRTVVLRTVFREDWKHMTGAVGGPERK